MEELEFSQLQLPIYDIVCNSNALRRYQDMLINESGAIKDLYFGYTGMLLTHEKRKLILAKLVELYPDMMIVPNTWTCILKDFKSEKSIPYELIGNFYADSMININISSMHMPSSLNSRVFDVPEAGGFLITDYREGIYDLFEEKEIVTYKEVEEIYDYIEYYTKHENQRNQIVKKAAERILKEHTYVKRINYILDKYRKNWGK